MGKVRKISTPLKGQDIRTLNAGDEVLISGEIYTARDQAHLRLYKMIKEGRELPLDLSDKIIYYCGPTPAGDRIIGSCGPTTSGRMDRFTPVLIEHGIRGLIGKGKRSAEVRDTIRLAKAVYFIAPSGAGAYLSKKVVASEIIAFDDLGPEAVYKLEVRDFPVIVAIDSEGRDIYV